MKDFIVEVFCICDDFLKHISYKDDNQSIMTNSEVMTFAIIAARYFSGNHSLTRLFLLEHGYMHHILSKSRLNRRFHALDSSLWEQLFYLLASHFKLKSRSKDFSVDSFPVEVCDNIRIFKSKIYKDECFRGYIASKKRYFFGLRVHMITAKCGAPVEFMFTPGSVSDIKAFQRMHIDLPPGSRVFADKAYNDYLQEDLLEESKNIKLVPQRKKSSKRVLDGCLEYIRDKSRKQIETTFSMIKSLIPRRISSVLARCFELKLCNFIIAATFQMLLQ